MRDLVRPIPGLDGYFASSDGRIFTDWTSSPSSKRGAPLRERRQFTVKKSNGLYFRVQMRLAKGEYCNFSVHRLVAMAWHGLPPFEGAEVRHLDNNSTNNHAVNLAWGTRQENEDDKELFGTRHRGERAPRSTLTNEQADAIRRRYAAGGISQHHLAREFGVSRMVVQGVVTGRTYKVGSVA